MQYTVSDKYLPFGGDKHIVKSDCKLAGYPPQLFGSVVFRSRDEIDRLIASLTELRSNWEHETGHIHLQDYSRSTDPTELEVVFCTPAWADTEFEREIRSNLIRAARDTLMSAKNPADKIEAVLQQLARGPAVVRELIYEMPPELRKRRPAPGVWSAHEHAVHLPAIYPLINRRLDVMLSEPKPYIKGYEPSRDEPDDALLKLDLDSEMDRFERERKLLIERIRGLTPDEWAITAKHEEYGRYGVFIMFRHVALHDMHHAYKIEDRLLRKNWD